MSNHMKKNRVVTTEDILLKLCQSVSGVLSAATETHVTYSAMVQKINKTSLKPDFGCFVLFDGGFTGLVVINFTAKAALEIYSSYMRNMGIPEEELAVLHTSDEVGDVLGELMNQLVGDFTTKIRKELQTNITQNQPKMLSLNKQVLLSVDTNLDRPQARRVTFSTENNNIFYLELAMDKTEFIQMEEFEISEDESPDDIIESAQQQRAETHAEKSGTNKSGTKNDDIDPDAATDLLDELGL
jgi:chemotaxis protein CheY-P-specific phosphatase CheC